MLRHGRVSLRCVETPRVPDGAVARLLFEPKANLRRDLEVIDLSDDGNSRSRYPQQRRAAVSMIWKLAHKPT
jgi:hypothetical protein